MCWAGLECCHPPSPILYHWKSPLARPERGERRVLHRRLSLEFVITYKLYLCGGGRGRDGLHFLYSLPRSCRLDQARSPPQPLVLQTADADCLADRANEPQHRKLNGPFGTGCDGPQSRGTIRETSLHDMSEIIEGSQWVDSWVHRTHRCIMC